MSKRKNLNSTDVELGSLAKAIVPLPPLPDFQGDEVNLATLKEKGDHIRQKADEVRVWVQNTLTFLGALDGTGREERELVEDKISTAQAGLHHLLHEESVKAYRRAAWLATLRHFLSREVGSPEEVKPLLKDLVRQGYLNEDPDGSIQTATGRYSVPADSLFEKPEVEEISELLEKLSAAILAVERTERRQKAEALREQSTLSLDDFLAGKAGKWTVQVPPEEVPGQNGAAPYWRPGGLLLVETDGEGKCRPVDTVGHPSFSRAVEETRDLGVFLLVTSLGYPRPPLPKLDEARVRKLHLFWYLLQRGVKAVRAEVLILEEKTGMGREATVSLSNFFLEKEHGMCLAEYIGPWHTEDNGVIPTLFFLVERREGGEGKNLIILRNVPKHLQRFLGDLVAKEFEEGEAFSGVNYPLKGMLQAIYGQQRKVAEMAAK